MYNHRKTVCIAILAFVDVSKTCSVAQAKQQILHKKLSNAGKIPQAHSKKNEIEV